MTGKISRIIVAAFAAAVLGACASDGDRTSILKVYNWADYIDEDVLGEFEEWYKEQTGEEVKVIYQLFDINEVMLAKIEKGHEDFDVVCPSDYIIERMLRNDLLLPIDRDFGSTPDYISSNISPYIVDCFNKIDGSGKNANDYSVGYMWGTTGILYNKDHISRDEALSWRILENEDYAGKLFMKEAFRDVYAPMLMYLKQPQILSGEITRDEMMYDASDESIALVEEHLKSFKSNVAGWEADFGKEMMAKGKGWLNFTWSGDAVWAIREGALVNVPLDYAVPEEGSNVWFDGWVIPKYARNVKAARYFINFMCRSDIASRNMNVIGYVSAVGTKEILEAQTGLVDYAQNVDVSYFFGEDATNELLDPVQYPDKSVIERCSMMHDTGDRTEQMLAMWSRVKGDSVNVLTYAVIAAVVVFFVAVGVIRSRRRRHRSRRRSK